jgi:hypothetical protein
MKFLIIVFLRPNEASDSDLISPSFASQALWLEGIEMDASLIL